MKVAYVLNQYPKVSHSFIRREILALEAQGFEVKRIAMRGWHDNVVDENDVRERDRTFYVLQRGIGPLLLATLRASFKSPTRLFKALLLALKMGWRADRPLPYHLIYLTEACLVLHQMTVFGARHAHAHFGTNAAEIAMLTNALGGPTFSFTVHGPEEFDKPEFIGLREKINRAAFVVAISSFGRSQLFRWVGHEIWPKVHVVHCALESGFYAGTAQPIPQAPRVVCVGRLCEQKGQMLLLEAVGQLRDRGIKIELVLAGDGPMRSELESLIKLNNLEKAVRITGWISSSEVRAEIIAARALILPSFAEGLPVVVMEAMALHRPVLTTSVAGVPELVQSGKTGWLVPAGDVEALSRGLEKLLSVPIVELELITDEAYRRVTERHSVEVEASKLAALFRGQVIP